MSLMVFAGYNHRAAVQYMIDEFESSACQMYITVNINKLSNVTYGHDVRLTSKYIKADVLMLSDGDCSISDEFAQRVKQSKAALDCSIYSVLCAGGQVQDV